MFSSEQRPVMIYHVPFVLKSNRKSGSAVRPQRMAEAFKALGYRVMAIEGSSKERRKKFELVRRYVHSGGRIEFCYSEASTMPNALTDQDHLPRRPFLDYSFFRWCRKNHIPLGVFYRDIYWKYPEYLNNVNRVLALATRTLYRLDLLSYDKYVDIIFLPSLRMGEEIPVIQRPKLVALPPGSLKMEAKVEYSRPFTIFYVGSLGAPYYDMHELFKAVNQVPGARLICCTQEDSWEKVKSEYEPLLGDSVEIVHAYGSELHQYYLQAHCASLLVKPVDYRAFASPLKLYEYIGYGKPILASKQTLTGEFINQTAAGWAVNYSCDEIIKLLSTLVQNPAEYEEKIDYVEKIRSQHTWEARAEAAARELVALDRRRSTSKF